MVKNALSSIVFELFQDITLCLKIKRWTKFLRKDVDLSRIIFGVEAGGRSGEHWRSTLEHPDTPVLLWHEARKSS